MPPKKTSKYVVEYVQVNIDVGDCSFVLLVQDEKGKDPVIKSSVMIDGGNGSEISMQNIKRAMRRIEKKYQLKEGHLKLDAMVITHWARDHYIGLLKLLKEDLDKEEENSTGDTLPLEVSFLRYDPETKDPKSILYIPYPEMQVEGDKIVYSPPQSLTGKFGFDTLDGRRKRICKYQADMPSREDSILHDSPKELAADISELIGRDLFTDKRPTLAEVVSAADPEKLVKAHKATMPGLYCVAANNRYLKGGKTSDDLKNGGTPTNRSSIVCMIIREDSTMSHYLPGDAYQDLETKVIDWTGLDPIPHASTGKLTLKKRVAIVKASHHGAATSTPITLCQTYKPVYFIFPSGNRQPHLAWQTLLYVYSYCVSPLGNGNGSSTQDSGLCSAFTTSPLYWMDDRNIDIFDNEDPLTARNEAAETYRDTIWSFFDTPTVELNLVDQFVKKTKDNMTKKTPAERAEWIRSRFQHFVLQKFNRIHNDPISTSTSTDNSKLDSGVSSTFFTSRDDGHDVEVDRISVDPKSMPSVSNRSKTPAPLRGKPTKKKR